jgi:UDP-N-acetylmuramyl pentapeptide phosphotransferase/UDP-N-acetylglucosamine-1-phosphate transferase
LATLRPVTFPITFYVMAAASSLCVSAASLPFWRKWCMARGLIDNPGHRKIHDAPVPLAGGLAVMTGLVVPLIAAAALLWAGGANGLNSNPNFVRGSSNPFSLLSYGLHKRFAELTGIVAGGVGMLVLGLLDDRHELRPGPKFMGQFLIALLVASSGVRISVFIPNHVLHYIVTILWILTVINALNFMDNMNGLCAGLGIIASLYFGILAAIAGQYLVALIAFAGAGAMLGFLPHNFPRARAFWQPSGGLFAGSAGDSAALLHHQTPASLGRAGSAAGPGDSIIGPGLGSRSAHGGEETLLDWRYESSFAPARQARAEPRAGCGRHMADGCLDWIGSFPALNLIKFSPGRPRRLRIRRFCWRRLIPRRY